MNVLELLECTSGIIYNFENLDYEFNKIKIDSRCIENGDIFLSIKGKRFDGNDFIDAAFKNGAVLVITSLKLKNVPYILVEDTIKAMGDIASYMILKFKPKVIAITGSMGKTTTRNILYKILSTKYKILSNKGNYNNNIGVPLTVFNLNKEYDILLLELGMNHLKEISYLSHMIKPDISIITNIGSSHIGFLKSKENILMAKLEILDGMDKKILYVNGDDEYLKYIDGCIKCGFNSNNDFKGYSLNGDIFSSSFDIKYDKGYKINVNLPKHLTNNVLTSIKVSLDLNVPIDDIITSLNDYKTVSKRMEILHDKNNNVIINDCYNSSFESMTGVLDILKGEKQKKLLILGDINELGYKTNIMHNNLKKYLDKITNKEVILIGDKIKCLKICAKYFNNYKDTIDYLKTRKIENTLILIKASRSLELENITNYFTK